MTLSVRIQRINNREYSFALSSAEGVRYVIRALTFDNPDPYAYSNKIEKFNRRGLTFPVGMLRTLTEALTEAGVAFEVKDYDYSFPQGVTIDVRMTGRYEYQAKAVRAFYSRRWGIITVPTRGGKTFIAAEIARVFLATDSGNLLFCVDNTTLFTQAVEDFQRFFQPYGGIEIGEIRAGRVDTSKRVTVAMIQTLQSALRGGRTAESRERRKRVEKYMRELRFLAVDEIHENCSDSKLKLYKRCKRLEYQLCLSATPYRTGAFVQNLKLMAWSGDVIYEISEEELRGVGVLSDYKVFVLLVDHNDIAYKGIDEYDYADCRRKLIFESEFRNKVLKRAVEMFTGLGLKTLVLFQSVEHGRAFAEAMGGVPFLSGETKDKERERVKQEFLDCPDGGLLLASNIFKKGVTLPAAQILVNADGGLEDANTIQRCGRVLGTTANKNKSLILDFFDLYDAFFSEHSEARLDNYVDRIGEDNVFILDLSNEKWFDYLKKSTLRWFQLE